MNCSNCGAPLVLANGQLVLTCAYCRSSHRLDDSNVEGDRIVSLDEPSGMSCPCCHCELIEGALDGKRARYCPTCLGILVEGPIFAEIVRNRRGAFQGREMAAPGIDPAVFGRTIDCPECCQPMEVHHHAGAGRAVIDSCDDCHLVWLDHTELSNLERTPGRR